MPKLITGPVAALLTPRREEGNIDEDAFLRNIDLVLKCGVSGICLSGATGEYAAATLEERKRLTNLASGTLRKRVHLICCVGAVQFQDCVRLGRHALDTGADALLLPPPHFFSYAEGDVEAFYVQAAREIEGPILIYNLPAFTNPVPMPLVLRLVESVPHLRGIKDSSGSLEILQTLTQLKDESICRMVGHDAALGEALRSRSCDGAISGVAGVVPELIVGLLESHESNDADRFLSVLERLDELLVQLERLPTPWGLKLIARFRGIFDGSFPLPLSRSRIRQFEEFQQFFEGWWRQSEEVLALTHSKIDSR